MMFFFRALTASIVPLVSTALQATITSGTSECFYVDVESYKHGISLNYEALRGVADELETELMVDRDQILYTHKGTSGRYVSPIEKSGIYSACFKNDHSPVGDVVIGFSFHADDPNHEVLSNADATKIKHVQELEDLVYELSVNLDTVKDTQAFMKAITSHHNQLITSTHNRVAWWTLVEMFVLVIVSLAQISFLRRTLEVRRIL